MKTKQKLIFGIFAGIATLFIAFTFYGYQIFKTPNVLVSSEKGRYFYVKPGADFNTVAQELKKQDIINDVMSFHLVAKLLDYPQRIKPGAYFLEPKSTNLELVRMLRGGLQKPVKLVIGTARTKKDLSGKISKTVNIDSVELLKLLNSPAYVQKFGFDTATIKAMFLPNTYEVYWTISEEELLEKLYKAYVSFWDDKRKTKAAEIGLTPVQVSILASIVDAETHKKDEKKRIAGVYMNRLKKNMLLQADPTVVYANYDFGIKRVTGKHLQIDSPYNTYKYTGLPPAPINVPALQTIDDVLNYEKHDYLYFCAREDFSGYHNFAADFKEHSENARKYRKALDAAGY
jgi:UPF0755 protein